MSVTSNCKHCKAAGSVRVWILADHPWKGPIWRRPQYWLTNQQTLKRKRRVKHCKQWCQKCGCYSDTIFITNGQLFLTECSTRYSTGGFFLLQSGFGIGLDTKAHCGRTLGDAYQLTISNLASIMITLGKKSTTLKQYFKWHWIIQYMQFSWTQGLREKLFK